jgi:hypothetical protein
LSCDSGFTASANAHYSHFASAVGHEQQRATTRRAGCFSGGDKLPSVRSPDEVDTLVSERPPNISAQGVERVTETSDPGPRTAGPVHTLGRQPWTRADSAVVLGLVAIGVVLPAVMAVWLHAFGIPRYDDWAYRRVLSEFVQTGHISLVGWGAMTLVGQLLWSAPFVLVFGGQAWVAGFSVAVASVIGIVCAYWLARAVVGRAWGAACTLLVLACTGFLVNTSTFMTDLPAFAAEMACLAFGVAAFRHKGGVRWALVAAATGAGCAGFSVREFDLAAPIAVLVVLALQDRSNIRAYSLIAAGLLGLCGAIYLWTWDLTGAQHEGVSAPSTSDLRALAGGYFALALFVLPLLPAALRRCRPSRSRAGIVIAGVILVIGVVLLITGKSVFSGNYLTQQGMSTTATLSGFRPVLFPAPVWRLLEVIALGAGAALGFIAVDALEAARARSGWWRVGDVCERTVVGLFTVLSGAGLAVYALFVQGAVFDRYVWPLVFGTAVMLAAKAASPATSAPAHSSRPAAHSGRPVAGGPLDSTTRVATLVLAVFAGVVAMSATLNADSYDGARWSAGLQAVGAGYRPGTVDAGFDWVGSHTATAAVRGRLVAGAPSYETWYDKMFSSFRDCAFVSGSPVAAPHVALLGTLRYEEVGFAVPERLYIYGVRDPACERRAGAR